MLGKFSLAFEKYYHRFSDFYQKLIKWALVIKGKVGIATTVLFLTSLLFPAFGLIGNEFMPQADLGAG